MEAVFEQPKLDQACRIQNAQLIGGNLRNLGSEKLCSPTSD